MGWVQSSWLKNKLTPLTDVAGDTYLPVMNNAPTLALTDYVDDFIDGTFRVHSAVVSGDKLYYAAYNKLVLYSLSERKTLINRPYDGDYLKHIFVKNGTVYACASSGNEIYAYDATTLALLRESTRIGTDSNYSGCIDDTHIYLSNFGSKKVFKFRLDTLAKVGETPAQQGSTYSIACHNDVLYYADYSADKVIAFSTITMAKIKEYTGVDFIVRSMAISDEYLWLGGGDNFVGVCELKYTSFYKVKTSMSPEYVCVNGEKLYMYDNDTGEIAVYSVPLIYVSSTSISAPLDVIQTPFIGMRGITDGSDGAFLFGSFIRGITTANQISGYVREEK